jgi:Ca2+-binding EF-hand superfamily protein
MGGERGQHRRRKEEAPRGHSNGGNMKHPRKLTIAIAAVMAGAVFGPAAFANNASTSTTATQQFRQSDTNNDGQVSKSEFDNYWKQQFQAADTNNDNKLDRQECLTAGRRMEGPRFSQAKFDAMWNKVSQDGHISSGQDLAFHNRKFRQADTNDNGELSLAEARNAVQSGDETVASL